MADTFQLEIVTPEKLIVNAVADEAEMPGKTGCLGILPGHAPLITELAIGEISYRQNGAYNYLAVAWGFAEVLPEKVTILAQTAEPADQIDLKRAEQARDRAQQRLKQSDPATDLDRANLALERANARIEVAAKRHS
jgi:F-type H+-transporting ATPase subunit epsilon